MATFPSYAKLMLAGLAEQRESALLRTEMEAGPPRQARVRYRVMVTRNAQIHVNSLTDYQSFVTWFRDTINEGADWFDWTDPLTATTKSIRFAGGGLDASPLGQAGGPWVIRAKIEGWGT